MTDRITWINDTPPDNWGWGTENKSYSFNVKMKCEIIPKGLKGAGKPVAGGYMFYGGKRKLQSEKETIGQYIGSIGKDVKTELSKFIAKKYRELYATSEEVIVEIIDYDNFDNIGYGESKMLREAENMNGAAASEIWFNQTNGGGTGTQGYTKVPEMKLTKEKVDRTIKIVKEGRIKNPDIGKGTIEEQLEKINKLLEESGEDVYKVGFSDIKELKKMLSGDNILQVRDNLIVDWLVADLKEAFNLDPNPNKYGFSVQFVPENPKGLKKVISGNNRGTGCYKSQNGIGMFSVLIPYSDWGNWPWHVIKRFGGKFNPQIKNKRAPNAIEDAASDCIAWARGENWYKEDGKLNFKHKGNKDSLKEDGWSDNKIELIWDECERKLNNEELDEDDNIVVFSKKNIDNDIYPGIKEGYNEKIDAMTISEDNPDGEFHHVYKFSASVGAEGKALNEIMKWGWPTKDTGKKILFLVYFKSMDKRTRWRNDSINHEENTKGCKAKWEKTIQVVFNNFDIEWQEIPLTKKTAIRDGWMKVVKEEEEE